MKQKSIPSWIPSYGILFLVVLSALLILWVPGRSVLFLCFLVLNGVLCVLNRNYFTHGSVVTFSTLVGAVFVFSSLSKGVDPLGTVYMIEDYLEAYHAAWLSPLATFTSFALCLVEFCVGVFLLFNIKIRWTVWVLAVMMAFFTGLTWVDAVAEPVPDCGCFGKALVITNWQTFYKNLVIDAATLVLLFSAGRIRSRRKPAQVWTIAILWAVAFLAFEIYNYRYLPVVNFLEWKKGERLFPEHQLPLRHYMTYRNRSTGEEREYLLSECPFSDPQWVEEWEFVDRRDENPNPAAVNINILDKLDDEDPGIDVTRSLLEDDRYLFLVAVYDIDQASEKGLRKVADFVNKMYEAGYDACFLTSSDVERATAFKEDYGVADFPVFYADNTSIKAVIRSNPGVVLVRNAYVLGLWDWRRLPEPDAVDFHALQAAFGAAETEE